ncbi:unnamed protein product [Angiostrongylus costaricensis]|uniref:Uncharacterized protein n=1 Tax=Angiostrongylus costaricensis TaxID=334426 RepID=A0A0R3PY95_ANGCS|nr:unnamed protein product [Angiostrongylus costaricensis]
MREKTRCRIELHKRVLHAFNHLHDVWSEQCNGSVPLITKLDEEDAVELIALQSQHLGASHFRMKVWFQAENWLCVKNCLLDTIMTALMTKPFTVCGKSITMSEKKSREIWYKVIQFVIQNMKKGFLAVSLQFRLHFFLSLDFKNVYSFNTSKSIR